MTLDKIQTGKDENFKPKAILRMRSQTHPARGARIDLHTIYLRIAFMTYRMDSKIYQQTIITN